MNTIGFINNAKGRSVRFEIPDYLQSIIKTQQPYIDEMVLYHSNNIKDNEEYRDYVRFLDILADMDELIADSSIVKEQEEFVSDPEQRKLYARIIVLHNLTLLLQKTIDKMKMKMPAEGGERLFKGGQQGLSYSELEEQKTMNRILKLDGLPNKMVDLNNSRPYADREYPDPFSATNNNSELNMENNLPSSILLPIKGGAKFIRCKRRMNKKYTGGESTYSDIEANREINRIINTSALISDINTLNTNRPYADTTFPDPFSSGIISSPSYIQNSLGSTNTILPQLGGKKKSNKSK